MKLARSTWREREAKAGGREREAKAESAAVTGPGVRV